MSEGGDKEKSTFAGGIKYNKLQKHKLSKLNDKDKQRANDYQNYLKAKKKHKEDYKKQKKEIKKGPGSKADIKAALKNNKKNYKSNKYDAKENNHQTIKGKIGQRAKKLKSKFGGLKAKAAKIALKVLKISRKFGPIFLLFIIVIKIAIVVVSYSQAVGDTPHYYCDPDAPKSEKSSAVYKQYCSRDKLAWGVDNINGHYIVQDGPGPAASCAMLNMILRFYSLEDDEFAYGKSNVYSYLWQQDGRYTNKGNSVGGDELGVIANKSIRQVLNNGTDSINTDQNLNMLNGTRSFATSHNKSNFTMSNWGYLRDESIDYEDYMLKSDFYDSQADNDKWVWDLSLDNMANGTYWLDSNNKGSWNFSVRMGVTRCRVESFTIPSGDDGYEIFKNRIEYILNGDTDSSVDDDSRLYATQFSQYYKGSAGVVLQYVKLPINSNTSVSDNDSIETRHTILITKKSVNGSGKVTWYGVDSSLGTAGGWEGPLDGTRRFVSDDTAIANLLNGNANSYSDSNFTYYVERIAYCTHNRFF